MYLSQSVIHFTKMLGWVTILILSCVRDSFQAPGVVYDKVICTGSAPKTVQCSAREIMDIHSTTIAAVDNTGTCDDYHLPLRIAPSSLTCKRILKSDGDKIVQRCQGFESCSLDDTFVPSVRPAHQGQTCERVTNVIWFQYYCIYAYSTAKFVSVWPLPEPREISGLEIQMFSPNYPDYTPTGYFIYNCTLTPSRQHGITSHVTFKIIPKLVRMRPNRQNCQDNLYFMRGPDPIHHKAPTEYCSTAQGLNVWTDEVIEAVTYQEHMFVIYKGGGGAKYWLTVQATELVGGHNNRVNVTVSCAMLDIEPPSSESPEQVTPSPTARPSMPESPNQATDSSTTADNSVNKGPNSVTNGDDSNGSVLWAVLGAVLGLVFIVAFVAILLFFIIRRRNKDSPLDDEAADPRKPRPTSIQKMAALVTSRKKTKKPDEEKHVVKYKPDTEPKLDQSSKPSKPSKPAKAEDEISERNPKPDKPLRPARSHENNLVDKDKSETDPKPTKPAKPDRAEKMEPEIKPEISAKPSKPSKPPKVAVVKPVPKDDGVETNTKTTDNKPPEGAGDADSSPPEDDSELYSVPQKKKDPDYDNALDWVKDDEGDETVMCENDELYSSTGGIDKE